MKTLLRNTKLLYGVLTYSGFMGSYRLLKIIFLILILITFGEVIYYFFTLNNTKNNFSSINGDVIPSNLSIHPQRLSELAKYINTDDRKIYIVFETNTFIKEVYPGGKTVDGYFYPFAIAYEYQNGMLNLFTEEMLKKVKITIVKDEHNSFGSVQDLKSKDRVLIQAIQDHSISLTERIDNFSKELKNYYIYVYK